MKLTLGATTIGEGYPSFIVAELSANHQQDFEIAVKTIKAISEAGANAVKLQTYTPDTITIDCDNEYFRIKHGTLWDGQVLYELYRQAYTPWEWQPKLKAIAEEHGLVCFSTPFDRSAVDFLETMTVPAYKVASLEITDIPLIEYVASKGKPIILSTGIATLADIQDAVAACRGVGNDQIAILKCISSYPTALEEVNLRTVPHMRDSFKTLVGISDHTLGFAVPVASVALGATIIEKHFILDRKLGGPDAAFSLEPVEFKNMVTAIREVEKALGEVTYDLTPGALIASGFARSLFVTRDIAKDEVFTIENVRSIRPGQGMRPKYLSRIIGKRARKDITKGTPLDWDLVG